MVFVAAAAARGFLRCAEQQGELRRAGDVRGCVKTDGRLECVVYRVGIVVAGPRVVVGV